jgi:hypothetical protein
LRGWNVLGTEEENLDILGSRRIPCISCEYSSDSKRRLGTDCNQTTCNTHQVYQNLIQTFDGCSVYPTCSNGVKTVFVYSTSLHAGTSTTGQSKGTATFSIVFDNYALPTLIESARLTAENSTNGSPIFLLQCSSSTKICRHVLLNQNSPSLYVGAVNESALNAFTFEFYLSSNITLGAYYDYAFNFTNGDGVLGVALAH